jgi:uncharacterized protein YdeI (YjbR/CyaY-like superfamily)
VAAASRVGALTRARARTKPEAAKRRSSGGAQKRPVSPPQNAPKADTTRPLKRARTSSTAAPSSATTALKNTTPTFFPTAPDFRTWLESHHAASDYLWVGYHKKATQKPSVTWEETVDEALCYGWIDGLRKSVDAESYMIRFTPRKQTSVWSQRNIDRVEQLTREGRMKAAGSAAFAFKDAHPDSGYGYGSKLEEGDNTFELPDKMVSRFKRESIVAWEFLQAQPPGYRKKVARWVTGAKREDTRERRLATLIEDSGNRLRIKQLS